MSRMIIFSGNSNVEFATKVAQAAGVTLGSCNIGRFADGEVQVELHESVRGAKVFLIQSTCPPVNDSYMECFLMLDALKRASAANVTLVMPYYGYARQDRKGAPRAPISAKCVAELIAVAGANRLVAVDLHAAQIQGFFNGPVDHLFAIPTLARTWRSEMGFGPDFVVVSPDSGGVDRARAFAKRLECSMAIIDKRRSGPNEAKAYNLVGEVRGKIAILLDDMIDTAGTMVAGVDSLLKHGAKKVFAVATHPVLSGPALDRLQHSSIEKVWVTDTIPLKEGARNSSKFRVVSVAPVVAEAIQRVYTDTSVSALFDS